MSSYFGYDPSLTCNLGCGSNTKIDDCAMESIHLLCVILGRHPNNNTLAASSIWSKSLLGDNRLCSYPTWVQALNNA
jgi:hypothetical protein